MILDARDGLRGAFFGEDGRPVRWVRWYDTETHEFEAFASDPAAARRLGTPLDSILLRGKARLRFVPMGRAAAAAPKPTPPADKAAEAREARRGLPILMLPGRECDESLCHELAAWSVSDEQELEPERDAEGLWERAAAVRVRKYCPKHYRPPTFTSLRGVQSEVPVEKARPQ